MRKILIGLCAMAAMCSSVTAQNKINVDYDQIRTRMSDKAAYSKLLDRFEKGDLTLPAEDQMLVYYGFVYTDAYKGNEISREDEVRNMLNAKQFAEVWDMKEELMRENPVSPRMCRLVYESGVSMKLPFVEVKPYYDKCMLLYNIIDRSGSGTAQDPYMVIAEADQYEFMSNMLQVGQIDENAPAGDNCECFIVSGANNYNGTHVYFDITPCKNFASAE